MSGIKPRRLPAFLRLDPVLGWPGLKRADLGPGPLSPEAAPGGLSEDPRDGALRLAAQNGSEAPPLADLWGSLGGLTTPTGIAMAPDGRVLAADPEHGRLLVSPPTPGRTDLGGFSELLEPPPPEPDRREGPEWSGFAPPEPPGPYRLVRPRGICFAAWGDLVAADQGEGDEDGRLILYRWPDGAARHVLPLPGRPWDVSPCPDGGLAVALASGHRIARFDRGLRRLDWLGGAGVLHRPRHLVLEARPGGGFGLLAVDEDPETGAGRVARLDSLGRAEILEGEALDALWRGVYPPPFAFDAQGRLRRPAEPCGEPGAPMEGLKLDRRGRLLSGPALAPVPAQARLLRRGLWLSAALDSGLEGFVWDRLILDVDLPEATALEIETLTSEAPLEPLRLGDLDPGLWAPARRLEAGDPPEALIRSPPGRRLWLRLRFHGDGLSTPVLRAVEATGPRASSLALLPAPFHEDPQSRDFLDRFLSYFDAVRREIAAGIEEFPDLLSARRAPEDSGFLDWLASWFDLELAAEWPEAARRAFLARADALCRARGTVAGLTEALALHLGPEGPRPALIEEFRLRDWGAALRAKGDPEAALSLAGVQVWPDPERGPEDVAHRFLVVLPEAALPDAPSRAAATRLIEAFRPAHVAWRLLLVPPGVRVGCQSTIGVDMILSDVSAPRLGEARLGEARLAGA